MGRSKEIWVPYIGIIKKLIAMGKSNISISKIFNVSPGTISNIKSGKNWRVIE